jgi:hypothetical protein
LVYSDNDSLDWNFKDSNSISWGRDNSDNNNNNNNNNNNANGKRKSLRKLSQENNEVKRAKK